MIDARSVMDRAYEVHRAATKARRWPRQVLRLHWRVSPDVYQELVLAAGEIWSRAVRPFGRWSENEDRLFGWPIDIDAALPPNSMLLEEWAPA